jgi:hypothetical protein
LEADGESFDFTQPGVEPGLGDAVAEISHDLDQPLPLPWVDSQEWAADAGLTEMILTSLHSSMWLQGLRTVTRNTLALSPPGRVARAKALQVCRPTSDATCDTAIPNKRVIRNAIHSSFGL